MNGRRYNSKKILNIVRIDSSSGKFISQISFTSKQITKADPVKSYFDLMKNYSIVVIGVQNSCVKNYNWIKLMPNGNVTNEIRKQIGNFNSTYAILCKGGCLGHFHGLYKTSNQQWIRLNNFNLPVVKGKRKIILFAT